MRISDWSSDVCSSDLGEHDLAVLGHLFSGDVAHREIHVVAEDVRHDHGGGARAVAVDGLHIAAERRVQETMDLALGVVEATGARPAIGAAENSARTVSVAKDRKSTRLNSSH